MQPEGLTQRVTRKGQYFKARRLHPLLDLWFKEEFHKIVRKHIFKGPSDSTTTTWMWLIVFSVHAAELQP